MSMTAVAIPNTQQYATAKPPTGDSPSKTGAPQTHFLPEGLLVVDPMSRKLLVPYDSIYETRAFQRSSIPSLCMLFQGGRCRQGASCFQVHAEAQAIHELRAALAQRTACCTLHGSGEAPASGGSDLSAVIRVPELANATIDGGGGSGGVPVSRFSPTIGLQRCLDGAAAPMLCRSGGGSCRFGDECRFLHVCRELEPLCVRSPPKRMLSFAPPSPHQHHPQHHPSPNATAAVPTAIPPETPSLLGASMTSLGNSCTSLPTTPLRGWSVAPQQPGGGVDPDSSVRSSGSGSAVWTHEPYSWRCFAEPVA